MKRNHERLEEKILAEQAYINELLQSIEKNYAIAVDTAKEIARCRKQNAPTAELLDKMERILINTRFRANKLSLQLNKYILDIVCTRH